MLIFCYVLKVLLVHYIWISFVGHLDSGLGLVSIPVTRSF